MNIDYAKIIETADERREALKELDKLLADAALHERTLCDALGWLREVHGAYLALDAEGKKLLPETARTALEWVHDDIAKLGDVIDSNPQRSHAAYSHGVAYLAEGFQE